MSVGLSGLGFRCHKYIEVGEGLSPFSNGAEADDGDDGDDDTDDNGDDDDNDADDGDEDADDDDNGTERSR